MNRVLIVDEHPITRLSVRMLLTQEGFEVVAEAGNGAQAIQRIERHQPDILILDMNIEQVDALTIITHVKKMPLPAVVVVFTAQYAKHQPAQCIKAGADGYVDKTAELDELLKAIVAAQSGYKYFPCEVFDQTRPKEEIKSLDNLSARELQVLQQLSQGKRNKEIAGRMLLSSKTISTYKRRLLTKFGVDNLVDLVTVAKRIGLA